MSFLITVVAFLFIFSLLILVHELGHFWMAKRNGIKVEEFGFGLPPRIWGVKKGETLYSINWIPFGGFVRMLGEDARDKKASKSKRSFVNKSLWQRTQVVCAGVVMNLLLAWVLLSVGFMVGMQPLIVDSSDFLQSIRDDRIEVAHGVVVDAVVPDSWAEDNGFEEGEVISSLNGESIEDLAYFYEVIASGEPFLINGLEFSVTEGTSEMGLIFNVFELPRVIISSVEEGNVFEPGDILLSVADQTLFYSEELQMEMAEADGATLRFEVFRDTEIVELVVELPDPYRTIISMVLADSPAEEAGLKVADRVLTVNGVSVWTPQQVVEIVTSSEGDMIVYEVERDSEQLFFEMTKNEQGLVGVLLGTVFSSKNSTFSYYDGIEIASVTHVHDVRYPWHLAPIEALSEMQRIAGYTAVMLGQVFVDIFTTGSVPDSVAGPVGIAQMTGLYIQEGFVALMRFTALLSLSLAVINIFPFPALDGGRFLFIVIEAVRGRPVDTKLEGIIHSIGFVLLLLVIFLVTFQDIQRLFV